MTGKVIKETSDYALQVGTSRDDSSRCYQVVNRIYDVIEAESHLLPQAFEYLEQLQSALDARRDDENALSEETEVNVARPVFPH